MTSESTGDTTSSSIRGDGGEGCRRVPLHEREREVRR